MLTSNSTMDMIVFFVQWVRDASPLVWPSVAIFCIFGGCINSSKIAENVKMFGEIDELQSYGVLCQL
jgi:hypothetical protein